MQDTQEWSDERRAIIELIDDILSRLRKGAGSREIATMLETALDEVGAMDAGS